MHFDAILEQVISGALVSVEQDDHVFDDETFFADRFGSLEIIIEFIIQKL